MREEIITFPKKLKHDRCLWIRIKKIPRIVNISLLCQFARPILSPSAREMSNCKL